LQIFDKNQQKKQLLAVGHSAKTNSLSTALEMALYDMGIVLFPELLTQPAPQREELVRVLLEI